MSEAATSDPAGDGLPRVSLVIPGYNTASTVDACLGAVVPLLESGELAEIVFVDDGSTDSTRERVARHPVRLETRLHRGRGATRNFGWRTAQSPLVWFIDADCVAAPDALGWLRRQMDEPEVSAAGGSFDNPRPESLLASLIHEEIVERHRRMSREVDFLATGNVLYRRSVLERLGGFDESYLRAQDAELAYRVAAAGGRMRFDRRSRVEHFHDTHLGSYLRAQRKQGYWRMWLYRDYPGRSGGDAYSSLLDHLQPPLGVLVSLSLAVLVLAALAPGLGSAWGAAREWVLVPIALLALASLLGLLLAQIPMTRRLVRRKGEARYLWFAPFGALRAVFRGWGMVGGVLAVGWGALSGRRPGGGTP